MRNSYDESLYSIVEEPCVEINQQSHSFLSHTQIGQYLRFKYPVKSFHTLDLNYHFVSH